MFINNTCISEPTEIANLFNTFFSEIANDIRSKIPAASTNPDLFVQPSNSNFELLNCDHSTVKEIILSLETKTSLEIDDLNTKVLKRVPDLFSTPLAHVINLSLDTGILPDKLKISRTVPFFKAGLSTNLSNYRPITCLPVIFKMLSALFLSSSILTSL